MATVERSVTRLVVNLSSVASHPTGLGSYATRIAEHVLRRYDATVLAPNYLSLPTDTKRIDTPAAVAIGNGGAGLARLAGMVRRQAFYMRGPVRRGDIVYSPTHHGFLNATGQIVTIHDLITLHFPNNFPRQTRFFASVMPRLIARSRAVFTVSESTRLDVLKRYSVDPERVLVVPNSVDASNVTIARPEDKRDALLVVGCHLPHKNIEEVLQVAHLWMPRFRLRIVGASGYYGNRIRALVTKLRLNTHVEFLPFVDDATLDQLYREAAALLYPSTVEGFGLPPLEALARGTAAIVSDIPVHREVMGEAARFVRLGNENDWAMAFADLDASSGRVESAARRATLERYSPAAVAACFDAALLSVAPDLRAIQR